jgi:ATP/ADP translocase/HEAT repeat protein
MLQAFTDLRPEERRGAALAFVTLFGILAAHTLLETARDALFLARLPASQLPWVYLIMAGVAVAISEGPWRLPRGFLARHGLSLVLVFGALVTLGFYWLDLAQGAWRLRALYVWTGLIGTLATLQFWLALGETWTITQAKRIFRVVAIGSVVGAVAGSACARVLSQNLPAQSLVLAAALLFAVTGLGPALFVRRPALAAADGRARVHSSLAGTVRMLREDPYVTRLAALVLVSTVALTLGDYVFKSTVARSVPKHELGAFFATLYMVLNVLALAVQLFLLGWLMRVLGLHRALWVLPALVCLGASGLVFGGGLVAGLLLKGSDGSLRHSLHRTTTELLFLPIPDSVRARAKPLIDVVGQRGGQALASVLILSEVVVGRREGTLAGAAAVLCVVWIALALDLKPLYLELFRTSLREGLVQRDPDAPELDLVSLETLFGALNSQDDAEVLGAIDLLAEEGRARLIPAPVVLRSLDLFVEAGRIDFVPIADRLRQHPEAEVRAAALRARTAVQPDEALLRQAQQDPSPLVRATALVGLVGSGWISDQAQETLDALLGCPDCEAHLALARAITRQPAPVFGPTLLTLARSENSEVRASAARAMGQLADPAFFPALLPLLARHETRQAAREAFRACGRPGLEFLDAALRDLALPRAVRLHVPRSLVGFDPAEAAAALSQALLDENDGGVRYKVLRALGRIAKRHPGVALDRRALGEAARRTAAAALRAVHWRHVLLRGVQDEPGRATPGHELLVALVGHKEEHAVERLFRLLGLLHSGEDFERLYRGLKSRNAKVRASSRELLENLLRPPLRDAVLALVDDAPADKRLAAAADFVGFLPTSYERLLGALLDEGDETVRSLAAYHAGELGLSGLRPRLDAFQVQGATPSFAAVLERALALMTTRASPASRAAGAGSDGF